MSSAEYGAVLNDLLLSVLWLIVLSVPLAACPIALFVYAKRLSGGAMGNQRRGGITTRFATRSPSWPATRVAHTVRRPHPGLCGGWWVTDSPTGMHAKRRERAFAR